MRPLCSFCNAFAVVAQVTERLDDGYVLDQTLYCEGDAKANRVPTGGPALSLVAVVEATPEMGR